MISPTNAKREVDVIEWILEKSESDDEKAVALRLKRFEGKHFRGLDLQEILETVNVIAHKLIKRDLIKSFRYEQSNVTPKLYLYFDIKEKKTVLEQYKQHLLYEIGKVELQNKLKKGNYFWFTDDSFFFVLPNGSTRPITFYSERGLDRMFLIMKVLYNQWLEFHDVFITKTEMKLKLKKLGWDNNDDKTLSNFIGNIRKTKVKPAGLENYISIVYSEKEKGYKLEVKYPHISSFTPTV